MEFDKEEKFVDSSVYETDMDNPLYLAFVFWTTLQCVMYYLLYTSSFFFWWSVLHTASFVALSYFTDGFQVLTPMVFEYLTNKCKKSQ